MTVDIIELYKKDLELIIDFEKSSWVPFAQADEESVVNRFDLGHTMLGIKEDKLIGMVSFSYNQFSPDDYKSFPKTFKEFSSQQTPANYNSVFLYSLAIRPEKRGNVYASRLVKEGFANARKNGCIHAVGDGRCSSYNGSSGFKQEEVKQSLKFKKVIDSYLETGKFPEQKEFLKDPTLAFYHRVTGCRFLWIIPDFLPEDKPAGGLRVILYSVLDKDEL